MLINRITKDGNLIHRVKQSFVVLCMLLSAPALADLAENIGVDVRSMSMGNAVVADPTGISAIHYNPAGLANIEGLETNLQGLLIDFKIKNKFSAPRDFEVFGYSDDPVVCNDDESVTDNICQEFKVGVSRTNGVSIFAPFLRKIVNMPKGIPTALPLPSIAYKPPGSKFTYSTAVYAEMVGGYNRDKDDPGSFMGQQVAMQRIVYASPTIAYQIDDNLSVGAGIKFTYNAVALKTKLRFPNELVGVFRFLDEEVCSSFKENGNIVTDLFLLGLCNTREGVGPFSSLGTIEVLTEDTASPALNLGVLWQPSDDFAWGLTYRTQSTMNLTGTYKLENSAASQQLIRAINSSTTGAIVSSLLGFPSFIPPVERGLVSSKLTWPKSVQTGIKYKLFPEMQFNVDVGWMDWKKWDGLTMTFDRAVPVLQIGKILSPYITVNSLTVPLSFESRWSLKFGWEYSMTDRLRFRLGYEPRKSSVPLNKRSPLLPINNTQLFGAGIGYSFDPNTEIDLGISYIRSKDNIPAGSSTLANQIGVNNAVLNPYAGLDVQTSTKIMLMGINYRTKW